MDKEDMLLTPMERRAIGQAYVGDPEKMREELAKAQLAKVEKRITDLEIELQMANEEITDRKNARLDRPGLREIQDLILDFLNPYTETNVGSILISDIEDLAKQILSLFDEEEIRKQERERILAELEDYLHYLSPSRESGLMCMYDYELQAMKEKG